MNNINTNKILDLILKRQELFHEVIYFTQKLLQTIEKDKRDKWKYFN